MIRLRLNGRPRPLYLLGVTRLNIERLTSGRPIKADLRELGGTDDVAIFFGEDAEALRSQLSQIVSDDELAAITPALDQLGATEREIRKGTAAS